MAPTPEQLLIDQNQLQIQAPQVGEQPVPTPIVKEGEVSMPSPQQWIGQIDYGVDWYKLGAQAFEAAKQIYPEVLRYNIRKKEAQVSDIIFDAETKVYDSYSNKKQQGSSSFGTPITSSVNGIDNIQQDFYKVQNEAAEKINNVFGFENPLYIKDSTGNYIPNESFNYDNFGTEWFGAIDSARQKYKSLAEAGERVQRDALLTMNKEVDAANAFNKFYNGENLTSEQRTTANGIIERSNPENFPVQLPTAILPELGITNPQEMGWVQSEDGTMAILDPNLLSKQPASLRAMLDSQYAQNNIPKAGTMVPDTFLRDYSEVAKAQNIGVVNPRTIERTLNTISYVNDIQFDSMMRQGTDISESGKARLSIFRFLKRNTNKSNDEIIRLASTVNLDTLNAVSSVMSQRVSLPTARARSSSNISKIEQNYSTFFMEQFKETGLSISSEDQLDIVLKTNPYIRDAYLSGLSFWAVPNQELNETERTNIAKDIIRSSLITPSTHVIKYTDETTGLPVFKPTGLYSPDMITRPSETTRTLQQVKGLAYVPVTVKMAIEDKQTGNIKLAYASQLAMQNLEGNIEDYTDIVATSFDESFGLTRNAIPTERLKKLVSTIRINRTNPQTGQSYDGGPTDAVLYKFALASSDQVLTKFNNGTLPRTPEETQAAFYAALDAIPTADQWGWEPNLSESTATMRMKSGGGAKLEMVLTDIPIYRENGVGNLMADTTVIPLANNRRSLQNPTSKQALSYYEDPKDENGNIVPEDAARDFNIWLNGVRNGTNPNQVSINANRRNITNPVEVFTIPKTNEELVTEISTNLIRQPNRNTTKDTILVGADSRMDTKAEFVMAIQDEIPFLLENAKTRDGISKEQALKVYSILTNDQVIDDLYERNKGNPFINTVADLTLSLKTFVSNGSQQEIAPEIDGIQSRVFSTKQKTILERMQQNKTTTEAQVAPQDKWVWNDSNLSWDRIKTETPLPPDFKYGGAIGMIRDFFGGKTTPTKEPTQVSPGAVSDKPYIKLISEFEGMKTEAYWDDTGKVWTIGKGTTTYRDGTSVKKGDKISKEEADSLMQDFVDTKIIPRLEATIPTWNEMNPNQQSALISFAYNMKNGQNFYGNKKFETLTKAVSSVDNFKNVPAALLLYNKSGGKFSNGLARRRKAEAALWSK
jgi:GH24 family phage-related lysozyme (muramidase)